VVVADTVNQQLQRHTALMPGDKKIKPITISFALFRMIQADLNGEKMV
jgi:hypothetical protein